MKKIFFCFYNLILFPPVKSPHAKHGIKRRHSQDDSHHKKEEENLRPEKLVKKRHTSGPVKEPVSGPAIEPTSGPAIEPVSGPAPAENQIPVDNTGMLP